MGTESESIPALRRIYRTTYANLPTTGLYEEDLGYATDRKVFYRWSGSAWEALTVYSGSGLAAAIPAAANLPEGSLYYETDTEKLQQVQSGAWVTIKSKPVSLTFATTQVFNGTSPTSWTDLNLSAVVGANQAIVLLKVSFQDPTVREISFRKNGDTDQFFGHVAYAHGVATTVGSNTIPSSYVLIVTDSSGIVEWITAAANTAILNLEAFWKL